MNNGQPHQSTAAPPLPASVGGSDRHREVYGVTKTGQLVVSRGLAEMTKGTGVTVNSVLPGPTRSEAIVVFLQKRASAPNATPEQAKTEHFERDRPTSLIQRMAEDSEVASLVAYLASPLAAATNGAAIRVEGGIFCVESCNDPASTDNGDITFWLTVAGKDGVKASNQMKEASSSCRRIEQYHTPWSSPAGNSQRRSRSNRMTAISREQGEVS